MLNQGTFNSTPVLTQPIKFCETCLIFRPPRTIHCNICDCCIRGFDHHCLWLGTCIGYRNYVSFQTFLLIINVVLPLSMGETIRALQYNASKDPLDITGVCLLAIFGFCLLVVSDIPSPLNYLIFVKGVRLDNDPDVLPCDISAEKRNDIWEDQRFVRYFLVCTKPLPQRQLFPQFDRTNTPAGPNWLSISASDRRSWRLEEGDSGENVSGDVWAQCDPIK